jgi:hypothetical protein
LAKHRDCQEKLRAEINETLTKVKARGDAYFTANDFESMPYLVAITKVRLNHLSASVRGQTPLSPRQEVLRIHSVAIDLVRVPLQDDIVPLTKPIVGTSGRVYTELHIPKGTAITVSMIGHSLCVFSTRPSPPRWNAHRIRFFCGRNQDLWGSDAYEFRPERWFDVKEQVESPIGVYGNLCDHPSVPMEPFSTEASGSLSSAFAGGVRSCIGWRFAYVDRLS